MRCLRFLAIADALLPGISAGFAQDAAQAVQARYGERMKKARSNFSPKDDIEVGRQILKDAESESDVALIEAMCDAVYDYLAKAPDGQETAVDAPRVMIRRVPPRKTDASTKLAPMLRSLAMGAREPVKKNNLFTELLELHLSRADDATAAGDAPAALSANRQALEIAKLIQDPRAEGLKAKIDALDASKPQPTAVKRGGAIQSALLERPVEILHTRDGAGIQQHATVNKTKLANSFLSRPSADAPGRVAFALDGTFRLLQGAAAIDDASADAASPLIFKIFVDGKPAWTSPPLRKKGVVQVYHLFILNAKKVEFVAECQDREAPPADAVWVEPMLYTDVVKAPKKPTSDYAGIPLDGSGAGSR